MNIKIITIFALVLMSLTSCAAINEKLDKALPKNMAPEKKAAAKCAIIAGTVGGAAGTIGGAFAAGGDGAAIGGVAGTALGAGLGGWFCYDKASDKNKETFNYVDTQKRIGYTTKQGNKLAIESVKLDSTELEQGDELEIEAAYYVMTPNQKNEVDVSEEWSLDSHRSTPVKIKMTQGTRETSIVIPLPKDAQKGKHTLSLTIKYLAKVSKKKTKAFSDKKTVVFTIV
jgi:hypothetical protein